MMVGPQNRESRRNRRGDVERVRSQWLLSDSRAGSDRGLRVMRPTRGLELCNHAYHILCRLRTGDQSLSPGGNLKTTVRVSASNKVSESNMAGFAHLGFKHPK